MSTENEFESSEVFDESLLDAPIKTEPTDQELISEEFNKEMDSRLGIEHEPIKEDVKPVFAINEDEFKSIVEKANAFDSYKAEAQTKFDKAFGTIGQLQAELKAVKERAPSQTTKLTKETFAKLTEHFDDDGALAEALAADLGELTLQGQQSQFDVEAFNADLETRLATREAKIKAEAHIDLLTAVHPDWQDITVKRDANGNPITNENGIYVHTDNFAAWHRSLSPEAQAKALSATDAPTLIRVLNEFKKWDSKKTDFEQKKQRRLEEAIPISSGVSGRNERNTQTDDFSAELQKRLAARS
jgi:hypothetical protein